MPEVAEQFQLAGVTALIYDPRSIGLSDGSPRNEIDPAKQAEDYSDALSFLATQPMVDPNRIAFWGMSFSGMIALTAAALDKRAKLVIVVCALVKFYEKDKVPKTLAMAIKDRQSQLRGNEPFYLPPFTSKGSNPLDLAAAGGERSSRVHGQRQGERRTKLRGSHDATVLCQNRQVAASLFHRVCQPHSSDDVGTGIRHHFTNRATARFVQGSVRPEKTARCQGEGTSEYPQW